MCKEVKGDLLFYSFPNRMISMKEHKTNTHFQWWKSGFARCFFDSLFMVLQALKLKDWRYVVMVMAKFIIAPSVLLMLLNSCSISQKTAKQELSDGFYKKKSFTKKSDVYVDVVDETIHIYPTTTQNNTVVIDTLTDFELYFPELKAQEKVDFSLTKYSFDIDFLTIPLKFRFTEKDIPAQLNTNLNGTVYFGYRTDIYKINYRTNPLKTAVRHIDHFGYSLGFFTGFGNTSISPTNTNNILQQEYDGVIWSKGVAGIIGINNFTIGLTVGFDNLLDKNKNSWIYENKPWVGLAFGLNLN